MYQTILRFAELLRKSGINVSLSEEEDALKAITAFGVTDENTVYTLLKATILKDEAAKDRFDSAWRICFYRKPKFQTEIAEMPCTGHDGEPGTGGMSQAAQRFYGLLRNRRGAEAAETIQEALRENNLPELSAKELAEQLKITLGWFMAAYALKQNEDEEGLLLMGELETFLKQCCEATVCRRNGSEAIEAELTAANQRERDFAALSEEQVRTMEKHIARLGKKLASRYSYRLKAAKNGIPDMRRIMADTALQGHLPAQMPCLNKKKNRPELAVLCDISGSMGIYSSFCLQLVCAMKRRFTSVRSFLFIENIVEAEFDFQGKTTAEAIAEAIDRAYPKRTGRSKAQCTTTGVSDYGRALEAFRRKFSDVLTENTTVLVVGDAKSNWFPPKPEELRDIRRQCNKLIWLNPEPAERWDTEDSVVRDYLPYCTVMAECRNLRQLEQIATQITSRFHS